jgi:hypothetical protein
VRRAASEKEWTTVEMRAGTGGLPRIYREKPQRVVAVGGAREPVVHEV